MRAKEAIEAECKTAQRSVEKQLKMLERAQEVEKNLIVQIVSQVTPGGPAHNRLDFARERLDELEECSVGAANTAGDSDVGEAAD